VECLTHPRRDGFGQRSLLLDIVCASSDADKMLPETKPTDPKVLRRGYADSAWGQLHYVEQGSGAVLLLLHQTPRSWDEFRELIPLLSDSYRVVAMDMLGFGDSAREGETQTIGAMASAALALMDAIEVDNFSVLGHHTGGAVALEVAAQAPERVARLVLSSTPWCGPEYRESRAAGFHVDAAETAEDGSHLLKLWSIRKPHYPAPAAGLLNRFIRDALAPGLDPTEGHRACARYVMEDRVKAVVAPTLLVGASADPYALPHLASLEKQLSSVTHLETAVIEGGTIPLMEQCPEQVASLVLTFGPRGT
jgi:pimeloyl-ACP methyl ester carboxylesterase